MLCCCLLGRWSERYSSAAADRGWGSALREGRTVAYLSWGASPGGWGAAAGAGAERGAGAGENVARAGGGAAGRGRGARGPNDAYFGSKRFRLDVRDD